MVRDLPVDAKPATPWFGQGGLGQQHRTGMGLEQLIEQGYLRPVGDNDAQSNSHRGVFA